MMVYAFATIFCVLLSGCTKREIAQKPVVAQRFTETCPPYKKKAFDPLDVERQEAALLDIAIPSYQERLPLFCEDQYTGQVVLGYYSDCQPEEHRKFFHETMERYGWNLRREFKGPELFLEFEKPARSCAVSIRPHNRIGFFDRAAGTDIVIYVEDSSVVY